MIVARTVLAEQLARIAAPGSFASHRTTSPRDLKLEVQGVGAIRLPVSAAAARRLCEAAQPARHGYREQTRLDKSVRDTWEIPARRISIDARTWKRTLDPQLEHIRRDLGLPEGARLEAQLHNLLVYAPGQFFVSHQDSEKTDRMIGTLVVCLPSRFRGGAIVIEHHDAKLQVRGSATQLGFVAFYADCHHEVRPVTEGYRVVLTYNLVLKGGASLARGPSAGIEALAECIREHFRKPPPPRWRGDTDHERPDRLVYLLDHQYTQRGLAWNRLKNADAPRAAALQEVARELDCEIFLALADVHETWDCESEGSGYGRRGWRDWEEDEEEGEEAEEPRFTGAGLNKRGMPAVTDLLDSEIELRHWVGAGLRQPVPGSFVEREELCYTKPSQDFEPFDSAHEGYMGNWGNTVEHWYHRAAVVMWPRERSFLIRAKSSASWALDELARHLEAGDAARARSLAQQLLPFWERIAALQKDSVGLREVLAVAARLGEPELARTLLAPFRLEALSAKLAPQLAVLLETYGIEWTRALLLEWASKKRIEPARERLQWIDAVLPAVCRALCGARSRDAQPFACWMLGEQRAWLAAETDRLRARSSERELAAQLPRLGAPMLSLIEGSRIAQDAELHRNIIEYLASAAAGPEVRLGVLHKARDRHAGDALRALGLQSVHAHCAQELKALLDKPVRAPDDWSIASPQPRCTCALCATLAQFLGATQRRCFDWPLAKDQRQHIHQTIDFLDLPVTHTTRRIGRPFTLQLEKTAALFTREAAARREREKDLEWLEQVAAEFAPPAPGDAGEFSAKERTSRKRATTSPRAILRSIERGRREGRGK